MGNTVFYGNDTDSNGCRTQNFTQSNSNIEIWVNYNHTTSVHQIQDLTTNRTFNFNTQPMTLRLETCGGVPLDGGVPAFGTGSSSSTWYWPGGATGSASNNAGESKAEAFPGGTYNFEMRFKGTEQKMGILIADPPQTVTWKTTLVKF